MDLFAPFINECVLKMIYTRYTVPFIYIKISYAVCIAHAHVYIFNTSSGVFILHKPVSD